MSVNVVNKSTGALTKVAGNAITEASGINYSHTTSGMSATNVQDAIDESYSELKSGLTDLSDHVDGDATTYPYADVITVEDAVPANLADCSVKVEPVQDLHGYDKPWVGGTGKNKLPMTVDGIKAANTDGTWSGNTYTYNGIVYTLVTDNDGNLVKITVNGTTSLRSFLIVGSMSGLIGQEVIMNGGASGGIASYTTSGYCLFTGGIGVPQKYDIGSGVTFTVSSYGGDVQINVNNTSVSNLDFYPMLRLSTETDATFAPYTNICPISGHTEAVVTVADDDTDPTVTNTYTLALGDTIYGGTVDFEKGVMTVDRAIIDLGSLTWLHEDVNSCFWSNELSPVRKLLSTDAICSAYEVYNQEVELIANAPIGKLSFQKNNDIRVIIRDISYDDVSTFTTAVTGQKLVYELATPFTVQLTPQQIQLLQGTNTIYADTGDISVSVNGVSGAIGAVQEQVNGLAEDVAEFCIDITDSVTLGTGVTDATVIKMGKIVFILLCATASANDYLITGLPTSKHVAVAIDSRAYIYNLGTILIANKTLENDAVSIWYIKN